MNLKVKKKLFLILWTIFLGLSIVFRCKPTLLYRKTIIEYLINLTLTFICLVMYLTNNKNKKILFFEILLLITPVFFLQNGNIDKYVIFTIIGILYYFIIQENPDDFYSIKYPILIFSLLTAIVSWVAYFKPDFYISNILSLFPEASSLKYSFLNRGMNHGFTNHYSRNALYIALGIMMTFCNILVEKKKRKSDILILLFLLCTMFLVAKRGTTLFLILTLFFAIIAKEKNLERKIRKSCKFILVGFILLIIAYVTIPGVSNLFNRIIAMSNSDDISTGRFFLYDIAWRMFINNPILGNGWGSFLKVMEGTTFQAVHNDYIQLLAETGIIGCLIFLLFNIYTFVYTYKIYQISFSKSNKNEEFNKYKIILCFSLMYQTFFILYSITGFPHFSYEQMLLYLMTSGAGIGMYKLKKDESKKIDNK